VVAVIAEAAVARDPSSKVAEFEQKA